MNTLRIASFGIRGRVGDSLTPIGAVRFGTAFGAFAGAGDVVLASDTRRSSPMLTAAVRSALMSTGCRVLDLGICPTPMLQYLVSKWGAAGGVSVSGGHNAMGWNSISLIDARGAFLDPVSGEAVLDAFHTGGPDGHVASDRAGTVEPQSGFSREYFDGLRAAVDCDAIRQAGFKILMDPIAGAGCAFLNEFAETVGVTLFPVNGEPSDYLPREPEPRPRSAQQMASIIQAVGGDAGFVFSSDMGRLSLVTEDGEPISEEYSFALITDHVLQKTPDSVITNPCTSRMIDDLAQTHQVSLMKSRVGQAYLQSMAADERAVLAGEGSGSAAYLPFSPAFDGFLMTALILENMAMRSAPLSELKASLPQYHITKRSVPCPSSQVYRILDSVTQYFKRRLRGELSQLDGVRVDLDTGWIHARASRTQQLIRVISEDEQEETAEARADDLFQHILQEI